MNQPSGRLASQFYHQDHQSMHETGERGLFFCNKRGEKKVFDQTIILYLALFQICLFYKKLISRTELFMV